MENYFSSQTLRFELSVNPWLRLLLAFAGGVGAASWLPPEVHSFYGGMNGLLCFLLLGYLLALFNKQGMGLGKWIPGSAGLFFLFCSGFQLTRGEISLHFPEHFSKQATAALHVQVNTIPEQRGKYLRFQALVLHGVKGRMQNNGQGFHKGSPKGSKSALAGVKGKLIKSKGRLMVYLRANSGPPVDYGDELLLASSYQPIPAPRNPAEFDYRGYLSAKDIYHQAFLYKGQWEHTGRNSGNPVRKWAAGLQQRCVSTYKRLFRDPENAALLSAFVLGSRSGLDKATVNAFADTGTIHILSVSGLHVAILYWLLSFILKPLLTFRQGKFPHLVLVICGITAYAFITGLSPPVCRAAWMIILYAIARFMGRQHEAGNILALTAFLLLTGDPLVLSDVGFQLSFLAAGGLIYFYPKINKAWCPAGFPLKQIWSMTAVSLAAQLTTFPLAVFYFHQFPVYFLPANLMLIPLTSLILYGGIFLLLISELHAPAAFLAGQLSFLMDLMKNIMHFFSELPGAVWDGIWINPLECIGFYLLIFCITFFLLSAKAVWIQAGLTLCMLLALSFTLEHYRSLRQRLIICFSTPGTTVTGFLAGKDAVLLHDKPLDKSTYEYSIKPFLDRSGVKTILHAGLEQDFRNDFLVKEGHYLQFLDKRLVLVNRHYSYPASPSGAMQTDILLVTENTYLEMEKLRHSLEIKMLASGAGNSEKMERFLEKYCRSREIRFYSLKKSGALLISLPAQPGDTPAIAGNHEL